MLPFSVGEFRSRVERVQALMEDRKIDSMIITRPENIYYLTGYRSIGHGIAPIQCVVLHKKGEPKILARMLEEDTVKARSWTKDAAFYMDQEDPFLILAKLVKQGDKLKRVGIELSSWYTPASTYLKLRRQLRFSVEDVSGLVDSLRLIKSDRELYYMEKSARLTELGIEKAIDVARPGLHEYEVFAEIIHTLYKHGQDDVMNTYLTVNSGKTIRAHDSYRARKIRKGDLVMVELNGCFELYSTNSIVSIYMGPPPEGVKKAHRVSVQLHDACRDSIKPGVSAEEIHRVADRVYRSAGYGEYFRRVGFSVGIQAQPTYFIGEEFSLVKGNKRPLEAGMTLSIEPGAYKPGLGGSIVGSNIVVTKRGWKQLTKPFLELYVK